MKDFSIVVACENCDDGQTNMRFKMKPIEQEKYTRRSKYWPFKATITTTLLQCPNCKSKVSVEVEK